MAGRFKFKQRHLSVNATNYFNNPSYEDINLPQRQSNIGLQLIKAAKEGSTDNLEYLLSLPEGMLLVATQSQYHATMSCELSMKIPFACRQKNGSYFLYMQHSITIRAQ